MESPPPLIEIGSHVPVPSRLESKDLEIMKNLNAEAEKFHKVDNGTESYPQPRLKAMNETEDDSDDLEDDDELDSETGCPDDDYNDAENGFVYECLICDVLEQSNTLLIQHMENIHQIDLVFIRDKYEMDQLSFIKMINWLRYLKLRSKEEEEIYGVLRTVGLKDILSAPQVVCTAPWKDERWLKGGLENDGLLQHCIEPLCESPEPGCQVCPDISQAFGLPNTNADIETECASLLNSKPSVDKSPKDQQLDPTFSEKVIESSKIIEDLRTALAKAFQEQQLMKETMSRVLGQTATLKDQVSSISGRSIKSSNKTKRSESEKKTDVVEVEDSWYFESYDDLGIHAEMLKDHPRTLAYKNAIQDNGEDFRGRIILDLGCGTGILSLFCADAGAKLVHAVDSSKIIYDAMDICFENNLESKIKFHKGKIETLDSSIEKVDIVVSEWMGYFLIFEGMLNSFLYARDNYLKPGGKLFPSTAEMFIVAVSDDEKYKCDVDMWNLQHGYKMGAMRKRVLQESSVQFIDKSTVVSEEICIKKLDLHTFQSKDTLISGMYEFNITKDCQLTAIGGYFSVGFDDGTNHKQQLSTSPSHSHTHWKQVVFYLPEKLTVTKDEKVPIHFKCKPHPHNTRWLQIDIKIGSISSTYEMC